MGVVRLHCFAPTAAGFFLSHKCFHQPPLSCAFEVVQSQQCKHMGKKTPDRFVSDIDSLPGIILCLGPKLKTSIHLAASDLPPARPHTSA